MQRIAGSSASYWCAGQGLPLVLLHGFCEDHRVWLPWAEPLADKIKLIMPDLPGFGATPIPDSLNQLTDYAAWLHDLLCQEQVTSCLMMGHSMGGYIALAYAAQYPAVLCGLGLFHSSALADDEAKRRERQRVADFVVQHGAELFVTELIPKLFADAYQVRHAAQWTQWKEHCMQCSAAEGIVRASLAMMQRPDRTEVLRKVPYPILFLIGQEDKVLPPHRLLPQTLLPERSFVKLLPGVAHMGMFEAPEACLEATRQWIDWCQG